MPARWLALQAANEVRQPSLNQASILLSCSLEIICSFMFECVVQILSVLCFRSRKKKTQNEKLQVQRVRKIPFFRQRKKGPHKGQAPRKEGRKNSVNFNKNEAYTYSPVLRLFSLGLLMCLATMNGNGPEKKDRYPNIRALASHLIKDMATAKTISIAWISPLICS